jgi:SAM-dependent methyltransferase
MFDKQVMEMMYRKAKAPQDLPWHREEPDRFLVDVLKKRGQPGRALDLGCGAGVFSIYLAKQGYQVTGLDMLPRALELARERARTERVEVGWVDADLLSWQAEKPYDIILDSGCLHSLIGADPRRYKEKLLSWLAPGGDYVLGHFGKRGFFDWRPVGPTRRTRAAIEGLFSPELKLVDYEQQVFETPLPIGPTVLGQGFWFKRG